MNYFYQQKSQQQLNRHITIHMKENKPCHTCQRQSYNLLNAACGHKICFHCVKSNKYSHKCSYCASNQPKSRPFLSPSRAVSQQPKQRSTKIKDSDSKMNSQYSPHMLIKSRPSIHRSSIGNPDEIQQSIQSISATITCKQHHEPLSMYCKSAKQLICSTCLCNRSKYGDVMPIKNAQDQLRKQNKLNKQQCKVILNSVQNASKIVYKNENIFKNTLQNSLIKIEDYFEQINKQSQILQNRLKQQITIYFEKKIDQFHQIQNDLEYLTQILKQYKQNNKQNCTFNQLLYLFSSFKVIKNTIKTLDLDYLPYYKQPHIIEINKNYIKDVFKNNIQLKLDLPLKIGHDKKKVKSNSNKSVSRSKNQQWDQIHRGGFTGKMTKEHRGSITKKHQMSLCNNIHGIEIGQQERNLYKILLKTKFKL